MLDLLKRKSAIDTNLVRKLDNVAPYLRRKLIDNLIDPNDECVYNEEDRNEAFGVLHGDAALNMYAINQTSHLIDWVLASNYGYTPCSELEDCLFIKNILTIESYDTPQLVNALSAIFQVIMNQLDSIDDETIIDTLAWWKSQQQFQEHTESLVYDLAMFHYEAALPIEGEKSAKRAVFEKMVKRYNNNKSK